MNKNKCEFYNRIVPIKTQKEETDKCEIPDPYDIWCEKQYMKEQRRNR